MNTGILPNQKKTVVINRNNQNNQFSQGTRIKELIEETERHIQTAWMIQTDAHNAIKVKFENILTYLKDAHALFIKRAEEERKEREEYMKSLQERIHNLETTIRSINGLEVHNYRKGLTDAVNDMNRQKIEYQQFVQEAQLRHNMIIAMIRNINTLMNGASHFWGIMNRSKQIIDRINFITEITDFNNKRVFQEMKDLHGQL